MSHCIMHLPGDIMSQLMHPPRWHFVPLSQYESPNLLIYLKMDLFQTPWLLGCVSNPRSEWRPLKRKGFNIGAAKKGSITPQSALCRDWSMVLGPGNIWVRHSSINYSDQWRHSHQEIINEICFIIFSRGSCSFVVCWITWKIPGLDFFKILGLGYP